MKSYTTDGKVVHFSKEEQINDKLSRILGDRFKDYRAEWDKVNQLELVTKFPLFLQLDMNQDCNFECPHCIVGDMSIANKYYNGDPLTWNQYKSIVDEAKEHNCPSISLQGNNEPLLIKDLEKYIKYAHDNGFIDIMINTNASPLTEKRAKSILDSGLTRIRFSLDAADKETFEKIRLGGRYDQVVRNIERFLELKEKGGYKLPVTGVSFCLQKDNEHQVDDFIKQWEDRVDMVTIQKFMPPAPEHGFDRFYPSGQEDNSQILTKGFKCPQPFQRVAIRNSEITPCCAAISGGLKIGEIGEDKIFDAWNSTGMQELRKLHMEGRWYDNDVCKTCVEMSDPQAKKTHDTGKIKVTTK
jgi:MoaA/NifB/PqqE/SkfB family radical SAM enzyme